MCSSFKVMYLINTIYIYIFFFFVFLNVEASNIIQSTSIIFYYGQNIKNSEYFELKQIPQIIYHPNFNTNNPTTLYIHGYAENQTDGSVPVIVDAYLKRPDINLLVLDWAIPAGGDYITNAIPNALQLGPILASVLIKIIQNGLNIRSFHIVGHSLGAQLAGLIGRQIISISNRNIKIERISGLDPASFGFYLLNERITASDANFVDIIHTDAWIYGTPFNTGTVNFWPNKGITLQPGCPIRNFQLLSDNDLCSHRRSWRFWGESVSGQYHIKFLSNNRNSLKPVEMGINCPTDVKGVYYLTTNSAPPYARGSKGLIDYSRRHKDLFLLNLAKFANP